MNTEKTSPPEVSGSPSGSALLAALDKFKELYAADYERELDSCERWIEWCKDQDDTHGMNFHQGKQSAHISLNITMQSLLRSLELIGQNVQAEEPKS